MIILSICDYFRQTYSQTHSHFVPLSLSPLGMPMGGLAVCQIAATRAGRGADPVP